MTDSDLLNVSRQLFTAALAPSTRTAYLASWRDFLSFAGQTALPNNDVLISEDTLASYIASLYVRGFSSRTIAAKLTGLSYYYKLYSATDWTKSFRIQQMLRGTFFLRPSLPDTRLPITLEDLEKICSALPRITYSVAEAALFRAAITFLFWGCCRAVEVCTDRHGVCHLARKNVIVHSESLSAWVYSTKTARGRFVRVAMSQHTEDRNICPIASQHYYLQFRPTAIPQEAYFLHSNGTPLKKSQLSSVFHKAVRHSQIPGRITLHSLRIGAATAAAEYGASAVDIQVLGRWKSSAFKTYIRTH